VSKEDNECVSAANRLNVCHTEKGQTLAMMLMAAVFAIPKKPQREGDDLRRTNNELRTSVARAKRGQWVSGSRSIECVSH